MSSFTTMRSAAAAIAALIALTLGVAAAAGDTATLDAVCGAASSAAGSCDTEYTPVAKPSSLWTQVGGQVHADAPSGSVDRYDPASDSPTAVTDNLYAVAFRNELHGLVAGSECNDTPPAGLSVAMPAKGPSTAGLDDYLAHCQRGPVLYTYDQPAAGLPGTWSKAAVEGSGAPGFIGAIGWIGPDKALAVGGTGSYPDREPGATQPGAPMPADKAGKGRAWLFDPLTYGDRGWHELSVPAQMSGLTALAFSLSPAKQCGADWNECGFAGGLRQIWTWKNGAFDPTPATSPAEVDPSKTDGSDWPFRVRQIRFDETPTKGRAFAVTDGCCTPFPSKNAGRVLIYAKDAGWSSRLLFPSTPEAAQALPDSYYGLGPNHGDGVSIIAAPGGPASPDEPASRVIGWWSGSQTWKSDLMFEALDPMLGPVRLVAGDGSDDIRPSGIVYRHGAAPDRDRDSLVDWAVGELTSNGQAAAFTPKDRPRPDGADFTPTHDERDTDVPEPLKCPSQWTVSGLDSNPVPALQKCRADAGYLAGQEESSSLFALSSYALNAFQEVGTSGIGWAAGDRGALVRKGGTGTSSRDTETPPPTLGAPSAASLPDDAPYDAFRPVQANEIGTVPVLGAARRTLTSPVLAAAGSPDAYRPDGQQVGTIVMNGDGSEGWALGPKTGYTGSNTALFHYADGRWSACDPLGVSFNAHRYAPPDPACAPLGTMRKGAPLNFAIDAATRVPYEHQADPTETENFEVLAAGAAATVGTQQAPLLLRYRDRQWHEDLDGMRLVAETGVSDDATGIVFTSPNEGWMTTSAHTTTAGKAHILHYVRSDQDGKSVERWVDCATAPSSCDDPNRLLPYADAAGHPDLKLTSAGDRVYLYGARAGLDADSGDVTQAAAAAAPLQFPLILYHDPGGPWKSVGGGFDPKHGGTQDDQGEIYSLSVVESGGVYSGWATGVFGANPSVQLHDTPASSEAPTLLHLDPAAENPADRDQWKPDAGGAAADYRQTAQSQVLALPSADGKAAGPAFAAPSTDAYTPANPMIVYDPERPNWRVFPMPFGMVPRDYNVQTLGSVTAFAPDNDGGMWVAAASLSESTWFYHYTARPSAPVFTEVSHPVRERGTVAAGAPDGSLWVGTNSDRLYRYDRISGWGHVKIPGWDPGRIVTSGSPVNALAFGPGGDGVAVGKAGRIADLMPSAAVLDKAAGVVCTGLGAPGPCGSSRDLRAAAFGPDGSVLVGGDKRTLLFRPPGGAFAAVSKPDTAVRATITGISYPTAGRAWLTTDSGEVFEGTQTGSDWAWRRDTLDPDGNSVTTDGSGKLVPLRAIAVRPDGTGYAVGDGGIVLERTGSGDFPWRRINAGVRANLQSIAMSPDGKGMLVGGDDGLVLTLLGDRLEVANASDVYNPLLAPDFQSGGAKTVGVALLAGGHAGQVEAWAVTQLPGSSTRHTDLTPLSILHYASDPDDPLLNPEGRVEPLRDAPLPVDGELSFAAFGRTDCRFNTTLGSNDRPCPEPSGSNMANDVISGRVTDAIASQASAPGGPAFSLFTGDVDDIAGTSADNAADLPTDASVVHHRFVELTADPLARAGAPLFAALGGQDLSHSETCPPFVGFFVCNSTHRSRTGPSEAWQQAFGREPAPFGDDAPATTKGLSFVPVEPVTDDGKAQTHYAFDVQRGDARVARVVVADTSLKSLSEGDALQNPTEDQITWLRSVLCRAGEDTVPGETCTRAKDEPAIVVSNTPTYSYGPGGLSDTQSDGSSLEVLLFQYQVSAVVSGRLGWNGRYWATAPGLHCPAPGGDYVPDERAPRAGDSCSAAAVGAAPGAGAAVAKVTDAISSLSAPAGPASDTNSRSGIPFVVAASAGGPFGPTGTDSGDAPDGYWHGYTIVRLPASGDPAGLVVEQRPIFDWLSLDGRTHVMRPGQQMTLIGEGREAAGIDAPLRYDAIASPAITHRYALIEADPARPYLPKVDLANNEPHHYVRLDPTIAGIDEDTGLIRAGRSSHARVYALAVLSVGKLAASYPIVFEPRRSYVPPSPLRLAVPPVPPIQVASFSAHSLAPPPAGAPPSAPPPLSTTLRLPAPPALPGFPSATATPVAPLAPPAPPAPPAGHQAPPLTLTVTPVGVAVPPTTGVTAQPTPPVNPSPPSGARREAKQRQAATAKSEEGGANDAAHGRADNAEAPHSAPGSSMMRHPQQKPEPHAYRRRTAEPSTPQPWPHAHAHAQASAWVIGLEWGGGIAIMALALALGFTAGRPTPRRRVPTLPAAAHNQIRRIR